MTISQASHTPISSDTDEISGLLRQIWEIENPRTTHDRPVQNPDEQCALEQMEKSLKYVDGRYQVALPWKGECS